MFTHLPSRLRAGLLTAALALSPLLGRGQTALFTDDAGAKPTQLAEALSASRAVRLDLARTAALLAAAPAEGQTSAALEITLPLPNGSDGRFAVRRTQVMAPELAARFPAIQTYAGKGLSDPTASVRLDVGPGGFHAQVLAGGGQTFYIDPAVRGDLGHYLSFYKRDMLRQAITPSCEFTMGKKDSLKAARLAAAPGPGTPDAPALVVSGGALRTYRLAVSATGEYSRFHGGTVDLTMAAIVTSVNRVVGVYEKELAVRLVLVGGNERLIYLNGATDPFSNNDGGEMLGQNQRIVDSTIGPSNYDIGHIFSTNGGGVAAYASVCDGGSKASGVTGTGSPVGDSFDIDYVAHEMGHQFSGSHTFNSVTGSCDGNRSRNRAYEPGSGLTIMAYAGICGSDDLQPHSEPIFHAGSFEEMRAFIASTQCAVVTPTGNAVPTITLPAQNKVIPARTPFKLTGSATDEDGDRLTYAWEQFDLGPEGTPYAAQATNQTPPLFRSWMPDSLPTRYFPRLLNLVNNSLVIGERLPTVSRDMRFRLTVRDERVGPVGLIGGVASSDNLTVRVTSAAGPFRVLTPDTSTVTWTSGQPQTVTWDVAGTTANGVNCDSVQIRLSTDGGMTYPTVLGRAANTGSTTVLAPGFVTNRARVMVEAVDNYFFDISNRNFSITGQVCHVVTNVRVDSVSTTRALLRFRDVGPPPSDSYTIITEPATTTYDVSTDSVWLTGLQPSIHYTVSVVSNCSQSLISAASTVRFTTPAVPVCSVPSELSVTGITSTEAVVNFVPASAGTEYLVTTLPFTARIVTATSPVRLTGLNPSQNYTVIIRTRCGGTDSSAQVRTAFRTLAPAPENDACDRALPLTCGVAVTGTTAGAAATGDPTQGCGTSVDQGGVFYTLVTNDGAVDITTCGPGTNYDTKLFVYSGFCGSYTCIAGNDDTDNGFCDRPSTVSFTANQGEVYLVFVSGWDRESGNFSLEATCTPTAVGPRTAGGLEVFPNPAGSGASLHLRMAEGGKGQAVLRNLLGGEASVAAITGVETELSIQSLPAGTYVLTVKVEGKAPVVRKVVIE